MNKSLKKILSIILGVLFVILLGLVPTILIKTTALGVNLGINIKNKAENRNKQPLPTITIEPIEKEMFFHFLPGAKTYSLEISDKEKTGQITPSQVMANISTSSAKIFSTSCNDTASCNYAFELAKIAEEKKLLTTLTYDSCLDPKILRNIIPSFDAIKIEIGNLCENATGTPIELAMENIGIVIDNKKHLEISYHFNEMNAGDEQLSNFLSALKENADIETIIHFSNAIYQPTASTELIKHARDLATKAGFKYVYAEGINEDTYCTDGSIAIQRQNNFLLKNNLTDGACADGTVIPGIWK
jgi:pyruvate-formate lyase-activating enzyme